MPLKGAHSAWIRGERECRFFLGSFEKEGNEMVARGRVELPTPGL